MNTQYTEEQVKDIEEREEKGLKALTDLQLTPAAIMQKVNIGNDTFVDKVLPYLMDTKYPVPQSVPNASVTKPEN